MSTTARLAIDWVERGYIRDSGIRRGIRRRRGNRPRSRSVAYS